MICYEQDFPQSGLAVAPGNAGEQICFWIRNQPLQGLQIFSKSLDGSLFHAAAVGGASAFGQYPLGQFGETCSALRLNSRMSHCAMRRCSSSIQGVCGNLAGFAPRSFHAGRPFTTSSNLAWAWPPARRSRRCLRRDFSLIRGHAFLRVGRVFKFNAAPGKGMHLRDVRLTLLANLRFSQNREN